jgi:hypothetical protein
MCANGLCGRVRRFLQRGCEEQVVLVCRTEVASEEVGEDAAGEVEGCGVRCIGCVPGVVEGGEG